MTSRALSQLVPSLKTEFIIQFRRLKRKNIKGTRDSTELLRTIDEKYIEKNKEVYVLIGFVDLEKAFD